MKDLQAFKKAIKVLFSTMLQANMGHHAPHAANRLELAKPDFAPSVVSLRRLW
ncbi:hypothetical protein [Parasedimentitalea maritima]|uniref:Uncharacterized protein n=1 Tax=Parasedimentitalea maritima TaxID=2578117 RepID=A0A6A4RD55_9RHOB|nr:hypothetical protein [Zongyanglinia marina]KAE9628627.1 hypothetical protein GP644_15750 [Zongyanglinia marina]